MTLGNPESEHFPWTKNPTIEEIGEAHPETIDDLKDLDPIRTAAMFGSLLVIPRVQANCIRIEALVHAALAYCQGDRAPAADSVANSFASLGKGYCGLMEDPAEDLFVTLVNSPAGNFRIFEGILEGAGFHLQRIVNVVEGMPSRPPFDRIRNAVAAMLHLSDAVATRAGVMENSLGDESPHANLPADVSEHLPVASLALRFNERELADIGIPAESLNEFLFNLDGKSRLRTQAMGHTDLERRPIALYDGSYYLLLPTAIATAIIRMVIEFAISIRHATTFESALCREYSQLISELPILGKRLPQIDFDRIKGGYFRSAMTQVDPGRFLHFAFFVDATDNFAEDGMNGTNAQADVLARVLALHIQKASSEAKKSTEFREGISLLITCGYGRAFGLELVESLPDGWRMQSISAYDFSTLTWIDEFDALSLFSLLHAQEKLEGLNVNLINVNGLLNLVAWSEQLGGHLVPHGALPDGFVNPAAQSGILVPSNAMRDLRHKVMTKWNPRRVLDSGGQWVKVWKLNAGEFEEDNIAPFYASADDAREGRLRGVYVAPKRPWWINISAPDDSPRENVYEHWMMLCAWLRRAAPILDDAYTGLPATPVTCEVVFSEIVGITRDLIKPKSEEELSALIQVSAKPGVPLITIRVSQGWDDGLAQVNNFAERTLVAAIIEATANAANEYANSAKKVQLLTKICPDSEARYSHRYQARTFRDFLRSRGEDTKLTLINPLDDAASRIGLGWRVRSSESNARIYGVKECTSYLNDVVRVVLDDLCASLRKLNRRSFVIAALENHEATACDRDTWEQTARAILGMHDDKAAAMRTIVHHHARLNASFLTSRVLLEAAICECPLSGGNTPGKLDLSRAMAQVALAHGIGGWSDAIHWGAMEPKVRVTPLGDVHVNHAFIEEVYDPFSRAAAEAGVKHAAESYAELYTPSKVLPSVANLFDLRYQNAWEAEFGVSIDGLRAFVEELEDIGREPPAAVHSLPRSRLVTILESAANVSHEQANVTLDLLTLKPRQNWRVVSGYYTDKDWFPWRLRRRLSVFRRPLLQIDEHDDPAVFLAPGLMRDALYLMIRWFHTGEIPSSQATSSAMRKWIGHANNVQRTEFNSTVAARMRELGWQAEHEVRLTKILGRPLDRDYGDIDVLAWRPESSKVLAIECKDLHYNKTIGQVAEQLADFRGELGSDGKPDRLRRHLDRLAVLNAHKEEVAKALRLTPPIQLEGHLVFRNLVPMQFSWQKMATRVKLSLFTHLDQL